MTPASDLSFSMSSAALATFTPDLRDCGSTVFWEPERRPGDLAIAVGAFADPGFPAPEKVVFDHRRHPWVQGPA